ncbi:hypothetical protein MN116_003534 [Schistosoma mekongi]|uniref:SAM domain-containing protein n=1 Tax=Schistosoma mekongi TaxID=38744 RepID=A0AAE1ZDU4_SCHME|nr:hypothetical protein MN116_003534 [Schistosoma mekongi]
MSFCLHEEIISIHASSLDISKYLVNHGVPESISDIFTQNIIDGLSFCLLCEKDLDEMGVTQIGLRKRILFLSSVWRYQIKRSGSAEQTLKYIPGDNFAVELLNSKVSCESFPTKLNGDIGSDCSAESSSSSDISHDVVAEKSKSWKLIISAFYFLFSTCITSFVMVLAHERLPDMSRYPPLPDLFLDNLPHISWGFAAAEWVGIVLSAIWITILIFHKYRWILVRRFFVLIGTVLLLRSVTMIITSLSVPGKHLADHCSPYIVKNQTERLKRVLNIWLGMGMSISGIQTCGDYMFSGHTVCLTLLNFFITEYSPSKLHLLHTFSWVLNIFGVFFILACHEHYSIDVFVAIYVTSRLFLYYHCLASSNVLHQPGRERAMIWFPLFSFMEYDVKTTVPNVFEFPFPFMRKAYNPEHDESSLYINRYNNTYSTYDNKSTNIENKQAFHCILHKNTKSVSASNNAMSLTFRNTSKVGRKTKKYVTTIDDENRNAVNS